MGFVLQLRPSPVARLWCRSWASLVKYAFIMVYALCCDSPKFVEMSFKFFQVGAVRTIWQLSHFFTKLRKNPIG